MWYEKNFDQTDLKIDFRLLYTSGRILLIIEMNENIFIIPFEDYFDL